MGKASRIRRQRKEADRQRRRGMPADGGRRHDDVPPLDEIVVTALGATIEALCFGDEHAFTEYLTVLGTEQAPGWTREVSAVLARALCTSVAMTWRQGWQPAELVRQTRRELGEQHAALAAALIVEEMRGYPPTMVDDRWAAQVSALKPRFSWHNGASFLPAYRDTEPDALRVAVELWHMLGHLPPLEQLCPLPGTARAGLSAVRDEADERILGKIRALLAKAESTEFPEEAEALSARAQELMAKYRIDHALLAAQSGKKDKPIGRRIPVDNPYESPKVTLLHVVAVANRCKSIWQKQIGMSTVVGFEADLAAVELLFTSLLVQASTAMVREGAKRDAHGRSRTRAFRQSFLLAYAHRIGERLTQVTDHAEHAAAEVSGPSLLPVLAARHQAIDDAVNEMFEPGRLVHDRGAKVTDAEGWHSGLAAADLAVLHNRDQVPA
jgi:hypothetical protein